MKQINEDLVTIVKDSLALTEAMQKLVETRNIDKLKEIEPIHTKQIQTLCELMSQQTELSDQMLQDIQKILSISEEMTKQLSSFKNETGEDLKKLKKSHVVKKTYQDNL